MGKEHQQEGEGHSRFHDESEMLSNQLMAIHNKVNEDIQQVESEVMTRSKVWNAPLCEAVGQASRSM